MMQGLIQNRSHLVQFIRLNIINPYGKPEGLDKTFIDTKNGGRSISSNYHGNPYTIQIPP
jgi:hypothetical protein